MCSAPYNSKELKGAGNNFLHWPPDAHSACCGTGIAQYGHRRRIGGGAQRHRSADR